MSVLVGVDWHHVRLLLEHHGRLRQRQEPQSPQVHMPPVHTLRPRQLLVVHLVQRRLETIREFVTLRRGLDWWLVPAHLVHINLLLLLFLPEVLQRHQGFEMVLILVIFDMLPVLLLYELVRLPVLQLSLGLT